MVKCPNCKKMVEFSKSKWYHECGAVRMRYTIRVKREGRGAKARRENKAEKRA